VSHWCPAWFSFHILLASLSNVNIKINKINSSNDPQRCYFSIYIIHYKMKAICVSVGGRGGEEQGMVKSLVGEPEVSSLRNWRSNNQFWDAWY
jgi:hypothetical protein